MSDSIQHSTPAAEAEPSLSETVSKTFADLGVDQDLVDVLEQQGIVDAFPIQQLTIADALEGRDVCGKAKTGSGKTLAFGIPTVQRIADSQPGHVDGLILVPTRELATQVFEELQPLAAVKGLRALAVYGGADIEKQIKSLKRGVELVVATPGRMIDLLDRGAVSVSSVGHVVIDEADRMADMGFLPQVEWILRRIEGVHQTLLFSATLDGAVDSLVTRYQNDPVVTRWRPSEVTVEEMAHRFLAVHEMDRKRVVAAIVGSATRTMVFCNTKRACDRLAGDLAKLGVRPSRSTATSGSASGRRRSASSPTASCRRWSPPMSRPVASTSTTSTSSSTTTRQMTTRPTSTARAARPGPVARAWRSPWCCGTRSSRSSACRSGWPWTCRSSRSSPTTSA